MSEDQKLQQRVIEELEYDPAVDPAHIGVSARNGVVTLSGHVASAMERKLAELAVRRVKGVKALAMEVRVDVPAQKKLADDEIAGRAVQILQWALHLPEGAVQVTVQGGYVTLTGSVMHDFQRRQATECVYQLGGVRGVENRIGLTPRPVVPDVRSRIRNALERSADVDASGIEIEIADGGRAVLRGRVRSLHEQIVAENAALSAPGVSQVENHLNVVG